MYNISEIQIKLNQNCFLHIKEKKVSYDKIIDVWIKYYRFYEYRWNIE